MIKRIKSLLKCNKGLSNTIGVLCGALIICMFVAVILNGIALVNQNILIENFADELSAKVGELGKCKGDEIDKKYNELASAIGLSPEIEITGEYFNGSRKTVQYGDPITVNVHYKTKFIGIGDLYIPFNIKVIKTTQSEQYWK